MSHACDTFCTSLFDFIGCDPGYEDSFILDNVDARARACGGGGKVPN